MSTRQVSSLAGTCFLFLPILLSTVHAIVISNYLWVLKPMRRTFHLVRFVPSVLERDFHQDFLKTFNKMIKFPIFL